MCSPTLAMMAFSTGMQVYSSGQQAKAIEEQTDYQAAVDKNNSVIQTRMAEDALKRGDVAEDQHRKKIAQIKSSQRAQMGGSGVDVNTGSFAKVLQDTVDTGELDALTIRSNAEREAYGHQMAASNLNTQAGLTEMTGKNQARATIMGGATKVAGQWYSYQNAKNKIE